MDIENLGDVWQAGGRLYVRCAKPPRDGLKSVRSCGEQLELDVRTMLWMRGKAFPISMLSSSMRCPATCRSTDDRGLRCLARRVGCVRRGPDGRFGAFITGGWLSANSERDVMTSLGRMLLSGWVALGSPP